jgi:hypothetical protein
MGLEEPSHTLIVLCSERERERERKRGKGTVHQHTHIRRPRAADTGEQLVSEGTTLRAESAPPCVALRDQRVKERERNIPPLSVDRERRPG